MDPIQLRARLASITTQVRLNDSPSKSSIAAELRTLIAALDIKPPESKEVESNADNVKVYLNLTDAIGDIKTYGEKFGLSEEEIVNRLMTQISLYYPDELTSISYDTKTNAIEMVITYEDEVDDVTDDLDDFISNMTDEDPDDPEFFLLEYVIGLLNRHGVATSMVAVEPQ